MANTTNFGWETPDDTDLVKDGASAMRTLGNAIDTSLVDLKGGTTGQYLKKNSNTDLDYIWGDVSAGADWSLLNSGGTTLSGSTTTVSGISNKDKILILVTGATTNGAAALSATINSVSTNYYQAGYRLVSGSPYSTGNYVGFSTTTGSSIAFASPGSSGTAVHGSIMITGGNSTGSKTYQVTAGPDTVTDGVYRSYQGIVAEAATISSVSLTTGNSFTGGKIYVFASA